jgi:hypothetical protein
MKSKVTYGQLDKVLRSFGFDCRLVEKDPPARRYEHEGTGALISVPPFPETDPVYAHHLFAARVILDQFGIAEPEDFDAKLREEECGAK